MSKMWTPEEDLLIRIITRDGVAPVGSWTAFARVAGRSGFLEILARRTGG